MTFHLQSPIPRFAAGTVPYIAVVIGLYGLENAWVAMVGYHLGMAVVLWLARGRWDGKSLATGWSWRVGVLVTPLFISAGVAILLLWPMVKLSGIVLADVLDAYGLGGGAWWLFVGYYCLINPPLEELYWRGLLNSGTGRPIGTDLLFGGYHGLVMGLFVTVPWAVITVVLLCAISWIWRLAGHRFNGLALPWATHVVADVGVMAAVCLLR